MLEIECISEENPTPANVWANLRREAGRKGKVVAALASDAVSFITVGVLQHERVVVVLRLDVVGVYFAEFLHKFVHILHRTLEERTLQACAVGLRLAS